MNKELFERHEQEWKDHFAQSRKSLEQLLEREQELRNRYAAKDGKLDKNWRDTLQWERKQWSEEWGIKGSRATDISNRQHQQAKALETMNEMGIDVRLKEQLAAISEEEFAVEAALRGYRPDRPTDAEMEEMYQAHLQDNPGEPDVKDVEPSVQEPIPEYEEEEYEYSPSVTMTGAEFLAYVEKNTRRPAEQEQRDEALRELMQEHQIITGYYQGENEPVPEATRRRLDKQLAQFQSDWDGIPPDPPLSEWKTLEKADMETNWKERDSWRALIKQQGILEQHYVTTKGSVPDSSRGRMVQERDEFWEEVDRYNEAQKAAPIEAAQPSGADHFREQLEAQRLRTQNTIRPKGPG